MKISRLIEADVRICLGGLGCGCLGCRCACHRCLGYRCLGDRCLWWCRGGRHLFWHLRWWLRCWFHFGNCHRRDWCLCSHRRWCILGRHLAKDPESLGFKMFQESLGAMLNQRSFYMMLPPVEGSSLACSAPNTPSYRVFTLGHVISDPEWKRR